MPAIGLCSIDGAATSPNASSTSLLVMFAKGVIAMLVSKITTILSSG